MQDNYTIENDFGIWISVPGQEASVLRATFTTLKECPEKTEQNFETNRACINSSAWNPVETDASAPCIVFFFPVSSRHASESC
jgi:hypothetical protein